MWFSVNQLRQNPAKTQLILLGSKWQVEKDDILDVPIMVTSVRMVDSVRYLRVTVDSHLTMTGGGRLSCMTVVSWLLSCMAA